MPLANLLQENKGEILENWVNRVLASYPDDAAMIFRREKDRFANPIGYNTRHALTILYDLLFSGDQPDLTGVAAAVDDFVKIRAVQTFTPAAAVAFVRDLKIVVREYCRKQKATAPDLAEWQQFEDTLDAVSDQVFDVYMACRERLYKARLHEISSMNHMLTQHGCPSSFLDADQSAKAAVNPIHIHNNEAR